MHKPDPIESILARLMPPALSEDGQYEIESMLDTLAGIPEAVPPAKSSGMAWMRRIITGGIAATGVSAALIFPLATPPAPSSWAVVAPAAADPANDAPAGLVLVSESDRIKSMTDEGWQEDADGSPMQVLRLDVVEENSLLDEETGIIIQVSEPREEIFLMPVNTF